MVDYEREMTIEYLKGIQEKYIEGEGYERHPLPEWYALEKAIEVLEQRDILDKIKAEINTMPCAITSMREIYVRRDKVINILDKYKAESGEIAMETNPNKGVLEKINEEQDSLRATCEAWDKAIEKDGYVN